MDGLRKFISEDNHEAVKEGDMHHETRPKKVVKPKFTAPGAVIREGAAELTLRAHEEALLRTFIDTSNVGDHRQLSRIGTLLPGHFPGSRRTRV